VGQVQLSGKAVGCLVKEVRGPEGPEARTDRESAILRLLAQGMANKEIARDLGIAETTVKSHVRHILAKLGVCSRTQAALQAVTDGYVTIPRHEAVGNGHPGVMDVPAAMLNGHGAGREAPIVMNGHLRR
jgi:DNA-binding CsgD family transcriptional regulator